MGAGQLTPKSYIANMLSLQFNDSMRLAFLMIYPDCEINRFSLEN